MTLDSISVAAFRRILIGTVVVPSTLLAILAVVFFAQIVYLLAAAEGVSHTDRVIARGNALLKLLVDGETGMRGFLITGEPIFLEPYQVEEKDVGSAFEELMARVADNPPQVERLSSLRLAHVDWQHYARKMIDLRTEGGDYQTAIRNSEGKRRMDAMRGQIATFLDVEEQLRSDRARTVARATWTVVGVSLGLTLLIGSVLTVYTRRQLRAVAENYRQALSQAESQAEGLRKSAHRLAVLHEIDQSILAAESVPELTRAALGRMERVVPNDAALVVLFPASNAPGQVISRGQPEESRAANEALRSLTDAGAVEFSDRDAADTTTDLVAVAKRSPMQDRLLEMGYRSCIRAPLRSDGRLFGGLVLAATRPAAFSGEHQQITEEVARQLSIAVQHALFREQLQRNAAELEQRVQTRTRELQVSLERVKQLQGLLPMCAWCKKVRDGEDYWHEVESYITSHSEVRFTHGICPTCETLLKSALGKPPSA